RCRPASSVRAHPARCAHAARQPPHRSHRRQTRLSRALTAARTRRNTGHEPHAFTTSARVRVCTHGSAKSHVFTHGGTSRARFSTERLARHCAHHVLSENRT